MSRQASGATITIEASTIFHGVDIDSTSGVTARHLLSLHDMSTRRARYDDLFGATIRIRRLSTTGNDVASPSTSRRPCRGLPSRASRESRDKSKSTSRRERVCSRMPRHRYTGRRSLSKANDDYSSEPADVEYDVDRQLSGTARYQSRERRGLVHPWAVITAGQWLSSPGRSPAANGRTGQNITPARAYCEPPSSRPHGRRAKLAPEVAGNDAAVPWRSFDIDHRRAFRFVESRHFHLSSRRCERQWRPRHARRMYYLINLYDRAIYEEGLL